MIFHNPLIEFNSDIFKIIDYLLKFYLILFEDNDEAFYPLLIFLNDPYKLFPQVNIKEKKDSMLISSKCETLWP